MRAVNEARKSGKRAGRQNGSDQRVIFAVEWAQESRKKFAGPLLTQRTGEEIAEILQPVRTRQESAPEADPYDKLVEQFGLPYTVNDKGVIRVNQMFARFAVEHLVLHDPRNASLHS